jgi:hypothetical protein
MTEGRTIAIGDVHGCLAALAALVRAIDPTALDTLVFLGDYIDRGPDSRGVLEQVIALAQRCTVVPLLGNHEEMLFAALEGQSELRYWLKFGGTEALASYAEAQLERIAAALPGAKAIAGNAPSDVERETCQPPCARQQLELKTLLVDKRGTITSGSMRTLGRAEFGPGRNYGCRT